MTVESLPISVDPSFEVQQQVEREQDAEQAPDYLKAGLLIGAGFLVWRKAVKSSMPELTEPTPLTIREALSPVISRFTPMWLKFTAPALKRAYDLGAHGGLDDEELSYLANVYAGQMQHYVGDTSAESLVQGFNALINRKWSPQIAYRRALEGFGLTDNGMRTYITAMENLDNTYIPHALTDDPRINATLTKLLSQRSISIGENEAYTVQEMGRQIMWMKAADQGHLSADLRRMWRVTKDERTCSMCKPLDETTTGLFEKFTVGDNEYWTPALHPNCRCWVELIEPDVVEKAYDPQKHPRGSNRKNSGQFSRNWGAPTKVAEANDVVDQIIADAMNASKPQAMSDLKSVGTLKGIGDLKSAFSGGSPKSLFDVRTASTSSALPQQMKASRLHDFKPLIGMTLPQSMVVFYKPKTSLLDYTDSDVVGTETVQGLYAWGYQPEDYHVGDVVNAVTDLPAPFVDNLDIATEMANSHADHIKSQIYSAIDRTPSLKRLYHNYLSDELSEQLYNMDEEELSQVATQTGEKPMDVFDDRDVVVHEIREYLIEPQMDPEGVDKFHHANAGQIISEHGPLMQAHEDALHQVMTDLMENHDSDITEAAKPYIPELFAPGTPYDDATVATSLYPTIYIVEDPDQVNVLDEPTIDMNFAASRPYALDGQYEVVHASHDESPTVFRTTQMVYLRKIANE